MIQIMRAVCCLAIVLFHSRYLAESELWGSMPLRFGYLAVEFFFITSGYLMAAKACRKEESGLPLNVDTRQYICHKFGRIYPYVAFAFAVATINICIVRQYDPVSGVFKALFEPLLLGASGLSTGYYNGPIWYLSALLLGSLILYPLCRRWKRTFTDLVAPVAALLLAGYLYRQCGNLCQDLYPYGLLRGLTGMCFGCAGYAVCQQLSQKEPGRGAKLLLTAVELIGYAVVLFGMQWNRPEHWDYQFLLILAVCIAISFSGKSYTAGIPAGGKWFGWVGKICLPVYLCHEFWAWHLKTYLPNQSVPARLAVYFAVVAATTAACLITVDGLKKLYEKRRKKQMPREAGA